MKKSFFVAILSLVLAVMVIPAVASAVDYDPVEITGVHQIEGAGDSEDSSGGEMEPFTCTFVLTAKDSAPMPEGSQDGVKEVEAAANSTFSFGEILYTEPGTYEYSVTRNAEEIEGIVTDESAYNVSVEVSEDGTNAVIYTKEGEDGEAEGIAYIDTQKQDEAPDAEAAKEPRLRAPSSRASVTIEGQKTWKGDTERDRPETITLGLYRNDESEPIATTTTTADDNWKYSFGDFPAASDSGDPYEYKVAEQPLDDYIVSKYYNDKDPDADKNGLAVTFSSQCKSDSTSGTPSSSYDQLQIFFRKDGKLYQYRLNGYYTAFGSLYSSSTYSLAGKTLNIPSKDIYFVWRPGRYNYATTSSYYGFAVTGITPTTVPDGSYNTGTLPTSNIRSSVELAAGEYPETEHNYEYYSGKPYDIWHYDVSTDSIEPANGFYSVENTYNRRTIEGKVFWFSDGGKEQKRPDSVTVKLYRNNEEVAETTASADDGWEYSFEKVPILDQNRAPYEYSVEQVESVDDYYTSYSQFEPFAHSTSAYGPGTDRFYIANDYEYTDVFATKTWDDSIPAEDIPDSITMDLYDGHGQKVDSQAVSPDGNGDWKATFTAKAFTISGKN